MLIIPAIDIKDGNVVRFTQGRLNKKIYSRSPVKTATHWVRQGAKLIHVVDLDGAISGAPKNLDIVREIASSQKVPIQFGGGVRKIETVRKLLDYGISRVIIGTKAIEDKFFLKRAFREFKQKVIVSVDVNNSQLLIRGWRVSSRDTDISAFARALKEIGFKQLIYTDISKDGTLKGPNIRGVKKLLKESGIEIIASGGISSLADINKLKILEKEGLAGVIVGKALYEGRFTLTAALKLA
ncbi:MAG: 1-(5-phosphoribosyl)-5-[(5-phosphoribosylamino)methylideneamino]imidazole-4-carboxamide isomerase [Candidatus Omnitrophica bacterium]|nr:1-(5-phosphoribosyl)-5-[(5-phosphoribosylamino)methylideneamino]imidazole-4-carboxamide isomerase [Candidatus Omnitrophota bacterium]MBU4473046.1 1-(5-phosphoribosyl)-5-[(5-phosphoribosylamino)methylideneamino]imidazole-4-carboxamide isomerase [Candidatus Omnitrophota bacterium]MCG2706663.1 1-(5-phosphoribosyl)-5-[(5-phosphoribosylamino)methylideneamino]imidazole-4-carboxamide isomerase [Candidatus Omnitrophota bacterium]